MPGYGELAGVTGRGVTIAIAAFGYWPAMWILGDLGVGVAVGGALTLAVGSWAFTRWRDAPDCDVNASAVYDQQRPFSSRCRPECRVCEPRARPSGRRW